MAARRREVGQRQKGELFTSQRWSLGNVEIASKRGGGRAEWKPLPLSVCWGRVTRFPPTMFSIYIVGK